MARQFDIKVSEEMVFSTKSRNTPFDRAHRVVLGTNLEPIFHVPGRIAASITHVVPDVL